MVKLVSKLAFVLGLTTAIATYAYAPTRAEPKLYLQVSGQESTRFDLDSFALLESLGLGLDYAENKAIPAPNYEHAFAVLPPTSDPSLRGTTAIFSYDDRTKEFLGSIIFDVFTNKLIVAILLIFLMTFLM